MKIHLAICILLYGTLIEASAHINYGNYDYNSYGNCECNYHYSEYNPCCVAECTYCDPVPIPAVKPCYTYCDNSWACCDSSGGGGGGVIPMKPGYCPITTSKRCQHTINNYASYIACSEDNQCPGIQKCCYDTCLTISVCREPVGSPYEHKGECTYKNATHGAIACPGRLIPLDICTTDSNCPITEKCCYDYCEKQYGCTDKTTPPIPSSDPSTAPPTTQPITTDDITTEDKTTPGHTGFCPIAGECYPPNPLLVTKSCTKDHECEPNEMCCFDRCLIDHICIEKVPSQDVHNGVCPAKPLSCSVQRKPCKEDTTCDRFSKCCYDSCVGYPTCVNVDENFPDVSTPDVSTPDVSTPDPITTTKAPVEKPGFCVTSKPSCGPTSGGGLVCTDDPSCPDQLKCCEDQCIQTGNKMRCEIPAKSPDGN